MQFKSLVGHQICFITAWWEPYKTSCQSGQIWKSHLNKVRKSVFLGQILDDFRSKSSRNHLFKEGMQSSPVPNGSVGPQHYFRTRLQVFLSFFKLSELARITWKITWKNFEKLRNKVTERDAQVAQACNATWGSLEVTSSLRGFLGHSLRWPCWRFQK